MDTIAEIQRQKERLQSRLAKLDQERALLCSELADYEAAERVFSRLSKQSNALSASSENLDEPRLKDVIIQAVMSSQNGMKQEEIVAYIREHSSLSVNVNSVSGTLFRHKKNGTLRHENGRWFPVVPAHLSGFQGAVNLGAVTPRPETDLLK
jgi:hypothetical protein